MKRPIGPCLACGDECTDARVYSGAVGPFCGVPCRNKQDDLKIWSRAQAYADRVAHHRDSEVSGGGDWILVADVARAFVIGYAAGLEEGHVNARRAVRK